VTAAAPAAAPAVTADPARARWKELRSPIVGTFYRAPAPTSPNFVNVGDHVSKGQPLCIIEAMKVMNEIEAEMAGTIREILVENGSPVEAEAVLFLVDPD
jgi:acetyl-CoA carboxylase biotin carboxyl carrier protein